MMPTTTQRRWLPIIPTVTSSPGARSPAAYDAVLDALRVEASTRYLPAGGETYCSTMTWDATLAMGAEIPHWINSAGEPQKPLAPGAFEIPANKVFDWLKAHGPRFGWREVTADEAQSAANRGEPTVAAWRNPAGHGHIAMVVPGPSIIGGPWCAQAGAWNFRRQRLVRCFGQRTVSFFTHV